MNWIGIARPKCSHEYVTHWLEGEVCLHCGRSRWVIEMSGRLSALSKRGWL